MPRRPENATIQEALDHCLDELFSGKATIEDCVSRYPQYAPELRQLLRTAGRLGSANQVRPSRAFKSRLRNELFDNGSPAPHSFVSTRRVVILAVVIVLVLGLAVWLGASLNMLGPMLGPGQPATENSRLAVEIFGMAIVSGFGFDEKL